MAMIMILMIAALATVALAEPEPTPAAVNNYIFIFNGASSSNKAANAAFEINKAHAIKQVANKLASPSDATMLFTIGGMSGFVANGLQEEDLKQLQSQLSTIGKFVPDTKYDFKLPRPSQKVAFSPPVTRAATVCVTKCCKRCVSTTYNLNLDMLDATMNGAYCAPANGAEKMNVFVLDTGVDAGHSFFKGRAVSFGDCKQPGLEPWTPNVDVDGHGTHVSGTIGADYFGMTTNVVINVIKVLNDASSGSVSSITCGITRIQQWLQSNPTAKAVVSISVVVNGINSILDAALDALATTYGTRLVIVVASGSWAGNACSYTFARGANVIAVGAVDRVLAEASYSNYGSCIDILAPGSSILSAYPHEQYAIMSGTGMATPLVSATIAQYWLDNPTLQGTNIRANINAASNALFNNQTTARNAATPNKLVQYYCTSCA